MPKRVLQRAAAAALLAGVAACRDPAAPGATVVLDVTDIAAPATFTAGEPFDVTLTVVTGGCTRFERFDDARAGDRLTLTAVGWDGSGPGIACTADVRYEPRAYTVRPPFGDSLVVVAGRSDAISRVVRRR